MHLFLLLTVFLFLSPIISSPKVRAQEILFYDNFDTKREKWITSRENDWKIYEVEGQNAYKCEFEGRDARSRSYPADQSSFGWKNYTVTLRMKSVMGVDQNVLVRVSPDFSSFYRVNVRAAGWVDSNNIRIQKFVNGERELFYQINPEEIGCNIENNKWYWFKIKIYENVFRVFIRCPSSQVFKEIFSLEDASPIEKGTIALGVWSGAWPLGMKKIYDDIMVYVETENIPLLIIPGLGASWNTRAMVYREQVPDNEWRMTPFVNVYKRLIETAKLNGYQEGETLFVWNYDWRRPLPEIAASLDEFIENTPELAGAEKIDIVGHSLGGLVARSWSQNSQDHANKTNKLIAVGSPHQGVVQAYEALAGGKVGDRIDLGWLAIQLLLQIHRQGFETNAEVVRRLVPVLQNITPTFNFLKKYSRVIPVNQAAFFNNHLSNLNQNFNLSQVSYFIVGNTGKNTPEWLWLKNQSLLDQILGLWPDGHPYRIINGPGDGTVLVKSARWESVNYDEFNLNHHRIISDPASVTKIMELLNKPNAEIAEVDPVYPNDNLLIFYLASPATLKVDGRRPEDSDLQFIIIPQPENKTYQAEITGTDTGTYHLYLGQITPSGNYWQTYKGEISPGEKKAYQFAIDFNNPQRDPLVDENGLSHFQEAKTLLEKLYQETNDRHLASSLAYLNQAIELTKQENWSETINKVKKTLYYSTRFRRKSTDSQIQETNQVQEAMKLLATGWQNILAAQNLSSRTRAYQEYRRARSYYSLANRLLRLFKRRKRPIAKTKAIAINESKELLDEIKIEWKKKNYSFVEPQSYLARLFAWSGFPK